MTPHLRFAFTLILALFSLVISAQEESTIQGRVYDVDTNEPISFATIYMDGTNNATESSDDGRFRFIVASGYDLELVISRIGYKEARVDIARLRPGDIANYEVGLTLETSDIEVVISASKIENSGMIRESVEQMKLIPSASGNFESILPHLALGTSSGTGGELSSQYNVRGGNYDENLVYVNDFEIYRPQLIRAGQQEGLSFPNIDLIKDLTFSSGGFESKYGAVSYTHLTLPTNREV